MLTLIVNPVAGSGYAEKISARLQEKLTERREAFKVLYTQDPTSAGKLAAAAAEDDDCTAVVAVGGDGTVFDVASALCGTGKPMGIIPAGTGNDFIKSAGIPKDPMQALDFLLSHQPRPVDMATVNDRMFINACGTGFDVQVLDHAASFKRMGRGMLPYMLGLIRAIFCYKPTRVHLTVDGVTEDRELLICSIDNGQYIGGGMPICPEAKIDDGKLDLVLVENVRRFEIPRYLPALISGKLLDLKQTTHRLCSEVVVESPGMRVNADGEILSMDSAVFSIRPGSLMLIW